MTSPVYSLETVRALALHTQGLSVANGREPSPVAERILKVVGQLGCVQIDTLHLVRRSHYLVLWSRLGSYDPGDFERLIYDPAQRSLFEGWQHAAAIIPLHDYRYQMPHQRRLREAPNKWLANWLSQPGNAELLPAVLERIRQEGPLRGADFEYHGPKRSGWWDWKPAKVALEYQYAFGELMITERVNFQRVYDLTERVLPGWVDTREPTVEERNRFWIEQAARALGVCVPTQAAGYAFLKLTPARPILAELHADGTLVPIRATLADGKTHSLIVHRDNLHLLEQAADGDLPARRTTFLSPFDNLFWASRRDEMFWGFRQRLEAYTPAPKRQWGYFCLPILHHDRLIGRFDPKLERQQGLLRLKALYLEPGVQLEDGLLTDISGALRDFMRFHQATDLAIERSQPEEFGRKLMNAM